MSDERGFSLIEVLIATALLAMAILAIANASLVAYRSVDQSGEQTTALILTQQRIEWLRNQDYSSAALAAGTTSQMFGGSFAGYTRTTAVQVDSPMAGLKTVTVTTVAPSGRSVQLLALVGE